MTLSWVGFGLASAVVLALARLDALDDVRRKPEELGLAYKRHDGQ